MTSAAQETASTPGSTAENHTSGSGPDSEVAPSDGRGVIRADGW